MAADVRVIVDFAPPDERYRPVAGGNPARDESHHEARRVAVIGASPEDGKIGNSVMKNLINGGYQGAIYPIHPQGAGSAGEQGLQERQGYRGPIDVAVFAIPAPLVAGALAGMRREDRFPARC